MLEIFREFPKLKAAVLVNEIWNSLTHISLPTEKKGGRKKSGKNSPNPALFSPWSWRISSLFFILFFFPEFLRRTFVTWEGEDILTSGQFPHLSPPPHGQSEGIERERERGRKKKKRSKDKCVPEKQLFWTISKRKRAFGFGSRYFARDGAISRLLARLRVITIMVDKFLFSILLRLWYFVRTFCKQKTAQNYPIRFFWHKTMKLVPGPEPD